MQGGRSRIRPLRAKPNPAQILKKNWIRIRPSIHQKDGDPQNSEFIFFTTVPGLRLTRICLSIKTKSNIISLIWVIYEYAPTTEQHSIYLLYIHRACMYSISLLPKPAIRVYRECTSIVKVALFAVYFIFVNLLLSCCPKKGSRWLWRHWCSIHHHWCVTS